MQLMIGLLILSHVAVGWLAVRLFQYGLLYGRHWNYQEKTSDAPTNPSTVPTKAKSSTALPTIADWDKSPVPEQDMNFRNDQINPFAEPAIGGKDAIPPSPNV